jgi:predicted Rossmann-fold nucleotide-binding protein
MGSSFWQGLIDWMDKEVKSLGMITDRHMSLFHVEDDPAKVVELVLAYEYSHLSEANRLSSLPR